MAVRWYLSGKLLKKTDLADLSKFTTARTNLVMSVFVASKSGTEFSHLACRPFLQLLDPTEKSTISYLIGCGLAGLSGPAAVKTRVSATPTKIKRLFHASLFRAHTSLFNTAELDTTDKSQPDFLGFDELDQVHVFEAKASFIRTQYSYVVDGLRQISQIKGIRFPHPLPPVSIPAASRNVCFAFYSSTSVTEWPTAAPPVTVAAGARCVVVEYYPVVAVIPPPSRTMLSKLVSQLLGIQIIGLWIALLSAERVDVEGTWSVHHFNDRDTLVAIGIPTELIEEWNKRMEGLLPAVDGVQRIQNQYQKRDRLIQLVTELAEVTLEHEANFMDVLPAGVLPMESWRQLVR